MKKHLLFLMLFAGFIIAFTSCKKDNNNATLEGTWTNTKEHYMYYENDVIKSEETDYPDAVDARIYAFQNDQWVRYYADNSNPPAFSEDQTYTYTDGKLTLSRDGEIYEQFDVKTLSGRTLVLRLEDIDQFDDTTYKRVDEFTFEKR